MKKFLKWLLIVVAGLAVILFIAFKVLQSQTKKASPEETVVYQQNGMDLSVYYNRPSKRGREIFGALVPYGEVWRTGANEATTFATNKDISVAGQLLKAGKYTLWTIPDAERWTVIFNSKLYSWGVGFDSKALRDPAFDVIQVHAPVHQLQDPVEMFTIAFEPGSPVLLSLAWDQTRIALPIE